MNRSSALSRVQVSDRHAQREYIRSSIAVQSCTSREGGCGTRARAPPLYLLASPLTPQPHPQPQPPSASASASASPALLSAPSPPRSDHPHPHRVRCAPRPLRGVRAVPAGATRWPVPKLWRWVHAKQAVARAVSRALEWESHLCVHAACAGRDPQHSAAAVVLAAHQLSRLAAEVAEVARR